MLVVAERVDARALSTTDNSLARIALTDDGHDGIVRGGGNCAMRACVQDGIIHIAGTRRRRL